MRPSPGPPAARPHSEPCDLLTRPSVPENLAPGSAGGVTAELGCGAVVRLAPRARAPTTVDERLQQLLLAQALVHLHPHHVTAEPLRLLLRLGGERERR